MIYRKTPAKAPKTANCEQSGRGLIRRLLANKAGNTAAMVAAGMVPMAAMIGSGVDISRGYMVKTRLQQACDSGSLAARKMLAEQVAVGGVIPTEIETKATDFFESNFRDGQYATEDLSFDLSADDENNVEGTASVTMPTSVMGIFGQEELAFTVNCTAELSVANVDVMFVLDTTGSMTTLTDEGVTRMKALQDATFEFYDTVQDAAASTSRIRYGFMPYTSTVNVGRVIPSEYVRGGTSGETAVYQSREAKFTTTPAEYWTQTSAEYQPKPGYVLTLSSCNSYAGTKVNGYKKTVTTARTVYWDKVKKVSYYYCYLTDNITYDQPESTQFDHWDYKPTAWPVSNFYNSTSTSQATVPSRDLGEFRTSYWNGCIEEIATVATSDFSSGIPEGADDMDIDHVPDAADPNTKWKPMWREVAYFRDMFGSSKIYTQDLNSQYSQPIGTHWGVIGSKAGDNTGYQWDTTTSCPTQARKLAVYDGDSTARNTSFVNYVNGLQPYGGTMHDIGMIWGGRFISPNGIFGDDNAEAENGDPISRHIVFMTDGQADVWTKSYTAYGFEQMEGRILGTGSALPAFRNMTTEESLEALHNARLLAVCESIKRKNITIWLIAFDTTLNATFKSCADPGKSFDPENATELSETFQKIAAQIAELRLTQ